MKKIFLIFMLFLLPLQYAWAMAANYDTHNAQDSQAHFGHHEHPSSESHHDTTVFDTTDDLADDNKSDTNTQPAKCHIHCGFLHLSCAEVLSHGLPGFTPETNLYLNQYAFNYPSPPTNALERPNWLAAL